MNAKLTPTNVTMIALAVALTDDRGRRQRIFYHVGVGTSPGEHILGGAFGFGLSRDVRNVYRFIVQNFEPGDELFFFGFSRTEIVRRPTRDETPSASPTSKLNYRELTPHAIERGA